jgi:hypothetical protein
MLGESKAIEIMPNTYMYQISDSVLIKANKSQHKEMQ